MGKGMETLRERRRYTKKYCLEQIEKKYLEREKGKFKLPDELATLHNENKLLREIIKARARVGLTQAEVAKRMGTTRSAVCRLESLNLGKRNSPSINTLHAYAKAVSSRLEVRIIPRFQSWYKE
jgi:DNA-binding XRE family transcriptional regulator